jgi:hypothetical protein
MWKLAIIPLLLVGCHSTPPVVIATPVYHPTMPVPYEVCPIYWEVLEVEKTAKISLSYNDNVTAAICNRDIERFISQLINITCHYRQDLKESICIDN